MCILIEERVFNLWISSTLPASYIQIYESIGLRCFSLILYTASQAYEEDSIKAF